MRFAVSDCLRFFLSVDSSACLIPPLAAAGFVTFFSRLRWVEKSLFASAHYCFRLVSVI